MTCNCIAEVDEKLKEHNLQLSGYALMMPDFKAIFTVQTEWIDQNKAPKGKKKSPTKMHSSFCPFCGKPSKEPKA